MMVGLAFKVLIWGPHNVFPVGSYSIDRSVLCACLTPAVAQWAVLCCDLHTLSASEMLNKVKISLTVWTASFVLKGLILQEFVCPLCWLWKSVLPFWCYTFRFILAGLCVWLGGNTSHFPGGNLRLEFFLQQYSLGLSATHHMYSVPCFSWFFSPVAPAFSSCDSPFPLTTATITVLLHCFPFLCAHLVSFSCILQMFPHSYSEQIGQAPPIISCLLLLGPEIGTLVWKATRLLLHLFS